MNWIFKGKCHKFGDNIPVDDGIITMKMIRDRETRPEVLAQHVMENIDPDFINRVKPGDLLVAGKRFGLGNPHAQGFRGIKGLGVGLVVDWMPRGSYRNCVIAGVPVIPKCSGILDHVSDGDELEVNFENGLIKNCTTGVEIQGEPMPPYLREIIGAGGSTGYLKKQLEENQDK